MLERWGMVEGPVAEEPIRPPVILMDCAPWLMVLGSLAVANNNRSIISHFPWLAFVLSWAHDRLEPFTGNRFWGRTAITQNCHPPFFTNRSYYTATTQFSLGDSFAVVSYIDSGSHKALGPDQALIQTLIHCKRILRASKQQLINTTLRSNQCFNFHDLTQITLCARWSWC